MGMHITGVHLMAVYLTGVHLMAVHLIGVYLVGVHLMGVYLTGVHLMGVYLTGRAPHFIDVYFMDVYMFPNPKKLWGKPPALLNTVCRQQVKYSLQTTAFSRQASLQHGEQRFGAARGASFAA
jgi:hypothetical protein